MLNPEAFFFSFVFEIRSAPASLSATHRGFAFYVAHPHSLHLSV